MLRVRLPSEKGASEMSAIRLRVTVVVEHEGKVLLIREQTQRGIFYNLPGGIVEYLEAIPDAAKREVMEETGLLVEMERLIWIDDRIDQEGNGKHTVGVGVLAKLVGEETTPTPGGIVDEEIEWAGWVTLDEWKQLPNDHKTRPDQVKQVLSDPTYQPMYLGNMLSRAE
ncbi:ADP-ribose pyrophosphatase [Brevibacillus brevis]|nr:ADP-ribose pyrophosphatase [Brevibacillus brevis]